VEVWSTTLKTRIWSPRFALQQATHDYFKET